MTRREQGKQLFTTAEWGILALFVAGAAYALNGLITGSITI